MKTKDYLTEDGKKTALAKHLGIDYFEFEDSIYVGDYDEQMEEYENQKDDFDSFGDFVASECVLLDDEIENSYGEMFEAEGKEFYVYDDEEADEAWDESLENYIDECMEIPVNLLPYFDREKWKYDARVDGRGHSLSGYDGNENDEVGIDGVTYYIYRWN